jgi:L-alanine-DL-glutamate epimerase-like enolase superfamily enzyme
MAIERLETFTSEEASVVRLRTDDGDEGIGQLAPGNHDIAARVFHRLVAPHALGEDERDVEGVIDGVVETPEKPRLYKHPGSFVLRALCGLDTALWDLKGKREGESVCELLGGPSDPDPVGAYGSRLSRETGPDEEVEICSRYRDEAGLDAFKLKVGKRLAYETGEDVWPGRTEAVVSAVRDALGEEVDLLVDANGAYTAEKAIEVGESVLEPNGVVHFEEPCPYWELEWTARVREALDVPVAGGEQDNMVGQWGKTWERIVGTPAVDVAQPDVGYVGGVTRTMRVADMAAEAGLQCVPHGPNHSLQKVFTLHVMAAIDNAGPYPFEYRIPEGRTAGEMYAPEPVVEGGRVPVPDGPGWGVEVDPEWLATSQYEKSER